MAAVTALVPRGQCTVHCFDGAQSRDFSCKTEVLCSSMRYFRGHLKDVQTQQDVMISVHCDVQVFEWLLAFAQSSADPNNGAPHLTVPSVMPILIASNFLGMDLLVGVCLRFVAAHVLEVAAVSRDLAALPTELLQRLAQVVNEEQLEQLHASASSSSWQSSPQLGTEADVAVSSTGSDSHVCNQDQGSSASKAVLQSALQHLVGRLFKHKIEGLLRQLQTTVVRCRHCGAMFSLAEQQKLVCSMRDGANAWLIGSNRKHFGHEADHNWRLQDHIAALRAGSHDTKSSKGEQPHQYGPVSWRDIYWDVWGVVHVLFCSHCNQHYPAQQQSMCCYHPEPALYAAGTSMGRHPCCGATAQRRGDLALFSGGCCMRDHQPWTPPEAAAGHRAGPGHLASDEGRHTTAPDAEVLQVLQSFRHLVVPETSGTLISSPLAPSSSPYQDHEGLRYEQGAPPADPEVLLGVTGSAAAAAVQRPAGQQSPAAGRVSPDAAYVRSNSRNSRASISQLVSGNPPSITHVRQLYGSVSKPVGGTAMRARPTSPGPNSLGSQVSAPPPSMHSTTSILAPGSLSDDGGPASRASSRPDPCEPSRSASLSAQQVQDAASGHSTSSSTDSADVPTQRLLQSSFSAQAFLEQPPHTAVASSISTGRASATTGQPVNSPRHEKVVLSPRGPHALSSLGNSASPQRATTALDGEATCAVAGVPARATCGMHALGVSLRHLPGAAGSHPGCVPCAPPQLCQQAARKLRMELLHEDDNARMASLVAHLVACRPTMPTQGTWMAAAGGAADTAARTIAGSTKQAGALQPARAATGTVQAGRSSRSGNTPTRSISAARPSRDGAQTVLAPSRGSVVAASVQAGIAGAAGVPRPSSAPRMRAPLQPWPAVGFVPGMAAAYRGGGILGQRH